MTILGVSVVLRNSRNPLNRKFLAFTLSVSAWLIINYIAADLHISHATALLSNRLVNIAGGLAILLLLSFLLQLTALQRSQRWWGLLIVLNVAAWIACLTPFVVSDVTFAAHALVLQFGPLSFLYFGSLFITFLAVIRLLIIGHRRLTGALRAQVDAISASIFIVIPLILLSNAVLPLAGYYGLVSWSPLLISFIVFAMSYVIVKHRLFDLRLIIVRSFAYIVTLGVLSALYGFVSYQVTAHFARSYSSVLAGFLNISLIMLVMVAYEPIRRVFNKLTNKVFYKDAYDPQDLFDHLNRALVTSLDINYLMDQTTHIIAQYLKAEFCLVSVKGDNQSYRLFGTQRRPISDRDIKNVRSVTPSIQESVIMVDNLDHEHFPELLKVLRKNDIAVLVRLSPDLQNAEEGIGYIILGSKKSGGPYTTQDARVLDTIANELIIAIQNALRFEEIENFNITLQQRIETATQKLRRTNDKLRRLDEIKDDFISMASHQLRTPLTSVKGYVSMVLDGDGGRLTPMQRKLLNQSFISSQRMAYLISDLLNVSRLRTGKFVIDPVPSNLAKVVQDEVDQLQETVKGRELVLTYNRPEHFPMLMLDETKIRQVIMNFIDNAIYYTPSGGHIAVNLTETPKSIELTVVDDGIGVPKYEQHRLFTKFFRAHNAKHARPDGTGLGLFMAKKVVIAQGGAVIFKSQQGRGSTFGFTFPKRALGVPPKPATPAAPTPTSVVNNSSRPASPGNP